MEKKEIIETIEKLIKDEHKTSEAIYDFRDHTKDIITARQYLNKNKIQNIDVTNNSGFGIAFIKI